MADISKNEKDYFDFHECVNLGAADEAFIKQRFMKFYYPIADRFLKHNHHKFGLSPQETAYQFLGIDGTYTLQFHYDVKTIQKYYPDPQKLIFFELFHYGNRKTLGWFFTSQCDVIFFLFRAPRSKLYRYDKGYYFFLNNARHWLIGNKKRIQKYKICSNSRPSYNRKTGEKWDTYNIRVPPKDLPLNCLMEIPKSTFSKPWEQSYFYKFFNKEDF